MVSLEMAADPLKRAWPEIRTAYRLAHPGHDAILTCVYRSAAEQIECYAKGRTAPGSIITNCDGVKIRSKHNYFPSRALDFCIVVFGKVTWDPAEYEPVGRLGEAHGLVWGGSWVHFKDAPHLELKETIA